MAGNDTITVRILLAAKDAASNVVAGLGSALGSLSVTAAKVGAVLAGVGAYVGGKLFVDAIGSAADFEVALDTLQSKTGASAEEMVRLKEAATQAGATTSYTATEAAQALTILGAAGLSATDSIKTLPSVLALAKGESISLEQAAGLITDSVTIMGLSFSDAARATDVLTKAANLSNATAVGLGEALKYAGGEARTAGLSIEKTVAILDVFADSGLRGEQAGTTLRNILTQLGDPASQAREALAKLGITTGDLESVIDGLSKAGPAGEAAIRAFGVEAGPGLRALLAGGTAAIAEYTAKLQEAAGAAESSAKTMSDNLWGALDGLSSAWDTLRTSLVEPLLEPLKREADALAETLSGWTKSAQLEKIKTALAAAFEAGLVQVKAFGAALVSGVDWKKFADDSANWAVSVKTTMDGWAKSTGEAISTAKAVLTGLGVAWNTVAGVIHVAAAIMAKAMYYPMAGYAKVMEIMSLTGIVSKETAGKVRMAAESMKASSESNLKAAGDSFREAGAGIKELADGQERAKDTAKQLAEEQDAAALKTKAAVDAVATAVAKQQVAADKASAAYVQAFREAKFGSEEAASSLDELAVKAAEAKKALDDATKSAQAAYKKQVETAEAASETLASAQKKLDEASAAYAKVFTLAQGGSTKAIAELAGLEAGVIAAQKKLTEAAKAAGEAQLGLTNFGKAAKEAAPALDKTSGAAKTQAEQLKVLQAELEAARAKYAQFKDAGDAQGMADAAQAIQVVQDKMKGLATSADAASKKVVEAFQALGIESEATLDQVAANAKANFETIRNSGTATPVDIQNAFVAYAEKAIAANNGVADSALRAQAEQLGVGIKASEAGDQVIATTGKQTGVIGQLAAMREKDTKAAEDGLKIAESNAKVIEYEGKARVDHLKTLQKEAEARGDLQAAAQIGVQILQAEADTLYQNAAAQQAVADAAAKVLQAKIDAANADSEISEQEQEAIDRAGEMADAKQREADATLEAANAKQADADAAQNAADKADKLADSADKLRTITVDMAEVMRRAGVDLAAAGEYAQVAGEAFAKTYDAMVKISGLQFGDQKYLMYAKEAAESAAAHARAVDELAARQADLTAQLDAGNIGLDQYIDLLQRAAGASGRLGDEDLADLRDAIADAKSRMDDFADSAQDGLQSLQQEWAELNGQQIQAAIIEQQIERLKIETELAQAKKDGNAEAIAALTQQLALLDQIHAKQLQMLAEEEAARAIKAAEDAANEAERRASLSDEERRHEDTLNALKAQLAAAIKAQDEALKASILKQIEDEKRRHELVLANIEKERKAKEEAAKQAAQQAADAESPATQAVGAGAQRYPVNGGVQPTAGTRPPVASAAPPTASSGPITINIGGVLDVNDRLTLDSLARKLQPVFADLERRRA